MRHNRSINHLGRKSGHRKAMLANMASSLILHKRITTTVAKAKALREYVEPLITKSKDDSTHSRRMVFSYLKQKEAVTELFRIVAPKIATRPGGYTRIIKIGFRQGDAAEMAFIELVDFNDAVLAAAAPAEKAAPAAEAAPAEKKPATRRSRAKKTTENNEAKKAAVAAAPKAPKATAKAPVKKAPRKTQGK
ncbi:MAG: 50S ribosomal protein L17 [Alistipes sp.]|nr:50S ribosomal protein L17 [Candidatus Minthomonas equi]